MTSFKWLRQGAPVLLVLMLSACGNPASGPATPPDTETLFNRSCRSCHVNGSGGAPRVGDQQAWAPRIAQGREVLLQRTIAGYKGMPAMGMCRECSPDQLADLIEYMAGQNLQSPR